MKLRIISTFLVVSAMSVWAAACSNTQGRPTCLVGHGPYAVKYIPTGTPTGACAANKGEVIGVQKYDNPEKPDLAATIALRPATLVGLEGPGEGATAGQADVKTIAQGKLSSNDPDTGNICTAPALNEIHDQVGGTSISYTWSNVRFYVTPRVPGTQFAAQLDYVGEDGCTATYNALGVFPAVACEDGDGNPDDSLCGQSGDFGQISPDFKVKCDPDLLLCVLDSSNATLPVLKSAQ